MNKFITIIILLLFISAAPKAQTVNRNSVFGCAKIFGDSITFLNDFTISQQKRKTKEDANGQEWEIYLMHGTVYRFALCCYSKGSPIILKLYNDTLTEQNPFNEIRQHSKKKYFDFICKKSDVYKVSIRFKNSNILNQELDAIGILGFIRKIK